MTAAPRAPPHRGRPLLSMPNTDELDFVNLDAGATLRDVNDMLARLGIAKEILFGDPPTIIDAAVRHINDAGFDTYVWSEENRLDVHPGQHALVPRVALRRFLDAVDSRNGVTAFDAHLAQLAVKTHRRQDEAVRLLDDLLGEIADDGPTDKTLYAAKREAES